MTLPLIAAALGLAELAPSIARWLSGPQAESTARTIVDHAKRITQQEDMSQAQGVLQTQPELLIAFQKAMIELEHDRCKLEQHDRFHARERDISFITHGQRNYRADVMVVSAAVGLITCLGSLAYFSHDLPGEAVGILSTIAGIFGSCLKDAYAFEFGSSRGSRQKDSAVAVLLERQQT